ncbi:hypothetical protein [Sphingomonas carotinifaciens]|uniref:hypothetical protein n=1 Tax=Sphingomonas carotinifaciens TaxID=1166323 RepID=UPI001967E86D|nr:hypothetical protein [Sphingomonas carotinifaciens]
MAKVAKAVGVVAGVVGVLALTASTFGVGGAAAAAVLKTVTSVAAITSVVANTGAQVLAKKPPAQGSVTQTTIGTSQDACELLGRTYSPGARVHLTGYGAKYKDVQNPYLLAVDVVSVGGPVESLEQCLSDFAPITFSGTAAQGYFGGFLWRSSQLGAQREASALPLRYAGAPGWGAAARLSGKAAIAWNALFDKDGKVFSGGFPQVGSVWRGVKAYDPRKDSTYPGGMGPHRWADPSDTAAFDAARATWEYTTSPGLLALRNALGTWERDEPTGGRYRKVFGAGIPIDGLIVEDFVHLANVCDANGWKVGGRIFEPGNRWDNLKRILAAGGAEPAWRCGRLGVKVQAPRIALDTITANDLADDGDVVVGAMQGWEQRLNTLVPKYRSEAHRWEYVPANAIQITSYLAEDGEEKSEERQIDLVQDATQARQLCAYELMDRRELGEIELPCKPRLRRYGPGDLLIVDIPEAGLVAQPAVVLRRSLNPETMGVSLVLRGETLEKHAFALAATGEAPPTPGLRSTEDIDATLSSTNLVDWSQVRDPDGTRPDDNATNSADPDSPFGPDGTVKEAIATLDRVEPIAEAVEALEGVKVEHDDALGLLDGARVNMEAVQRQAERDAGKLDEAMLRLLSESARTREVLRDAGIVVDPSTGVVRIYAVDQVAERTSRVEIGLNSVRGTISLKADSEWVNEQIALAVLNPEQAAQLKPIIERIAKAEVSVDGLLGTITSKAEAVDLTQTNKRVTSVSETLDVLTGTITEKIDKTTFEGLETTVQSIEQTLSTLGDTTGMSLTIRQARLVADDAATAALRGTIAGDEANRRQIVQAAEARQDIYTRIRDGELTEATARLALAVEVGVVRAMTVAETSARVDALGAVAKDVRALGVASDEQALAIGEVRKAALTAEGGIAGTQMTIRQVAGRADTSDEALLRALIAGDEANRDRQRQVVQIQTEFTTTMVANEQSSAVARQALLARMGAAEAIIVETSRTLAEATRSIAEQISVIDATLADPKTGLPAAHASIAAVAKTAAEENSATAKSVTQVTARLDKAGGQGVTVEQAIEATDSRLEKVEGRYTITIDSKGNLVGFQLIGGEEGPGSFNLINTDLRMGTGRIIFNSGTFMKVQGVGFGVARDLIEWFGPTMALDQCSRANAISYEATNGDKYTGGAFTAGKLSAGGSSPSLAVDAVANVPPFVSNGRPITYVASWTYRRQWTRTYTPDADGRAAYDRDVATFGGGGDGISFFGSRTVEHQPSTIVLTRTFVGGADAEVGRRSFTTETLTMSGIAPTPGDAPGRADFTSSIGGSFTVNEPTLAPTPRTLRLALSRSFTMPADGTVQFLTIATAEDQA